MNYRYEKKNKQNQVYAGVLLALFMGITPNAFAGGEPLSTYDLGETVVTATKTKLECP